MTVAGDAEAVSSLSAVVEVVSEPDLPSFHLHRVNGGETRLLLGLVVGESDADVGQSVYE